MNSFGGIKIGFERVWSKVMWLKCVVILSTV